MSSPVALIRLLWLGMLLAWAIGTVFTQILLF
jgi:hypothetical protein